MKRGKLIKKRVGQAVGNGAEEANGSSDDLRQRVAETAYYLYEERERADGRDLEDCLKAEVIIQGGTE